MSDRHEDWFSQARKDLKAARDSLATENYEWASFQAQQAAEKAAKTLLQVCGIDMRGHTIFHLLSRAPSHVTIDPALLDSAKVLDGHYIQPRYPNGFASGYPAEFYTEAIAQGCIDHAEAILEFVEKNLP